MSQTQVQKLEGLLARVQQRRREPRLVAVGVAAPSANTNVAAPQLELAKAPERPVAPIEEAIAPSSPSSVPPAQSPSSIPPPAAPPSSMPPVSPRTQPLVSKPATSTIPPSEAQLRSPTEVLPAAELSSPSATRVSASPALPFDSAVRVTSAPRIESPKSFGDLLELSLALRPKSG